VILAAGLGNRALAKSVGIDLALFPQRGQLIITSRTDPFLRLPNSSVRQNREGTVLLGSTQEDVGYDKSIEVQALASIAARAIRAFPRIADLDVIRSWSCLRIMTPDGLPIYQESEACPGAFVATAHSGITLAGIHALELGPMLVEQGLPADLTPFAADRFGDWQAHAGGPAH
jgi:glycine/D-amino acid oxidase-like deaminating enzyme